MNFIKKVSSLVIVAFLSLFFFPVHDTHALDLSGQWDLIHSEQNPYWGCTYAQPTKTFGFEHMNNSVWGTTGCTGVRLYDGYAGAIGRGNLIVISIKLTYGTFDISTSNVGANVHYIGHEVSNQNDTDYFYNVYFISDSTSPYNNTYTALKVAKGGQPNWYFGITGISYYAPVNGVDYSQSISNISNQLQQTTNSIDNVNNTLQQQQQKEENAENNISNQKPSDVQNSTDNGTQSLLDTIGGFISGIGSVSASDCTIPANLNHVDLGVLDLCSLPVPSVVQVIGSIILVVIFVPLTIVLVKQIIGLVYWFIGG